MLGFYLNIEEEELKKPIYRIFSFKNFCSSVLTKKNALVHPSKWDDPLENYLLNHPIKTDKGNIKNSGRNQVYGQCWSLKNESDAMWRIYSSDMMGIKVKTTIKDLFESTYEQFEKDTLKFCFIGKVIYYNQEKETQKLVEAFENSHKFSHDGSLEAKQLLFKREAFSHEKEVRLIAFFRERNQTSKILEYNFEPHKIFKEIILDPRLDDHSISRYKEKLVALGLNEKIISKSKLYTLNKEELKALQHSFE